MITTNDLIQELTNVAVTLKLNADTAKSLSNQIHHVNTQMVYAINRLVDVREEMRKASKASEPPTPVDIAAWAEMVTVAIVALREIVFDGPKEVA